MLLYVTMTDVIQCKKEQFWFLLASIIFTEDLVEQDSCKRLFLGFGMSLCSEPPPKRPPFDAISEWF